MALFRFHRLEAALQKIEALAALLDSSFGQRVPDKKRQELAKSLESLRRCVSATSPPDLATLTVRVVTVTYSEELSHGAPPAGEGVYIKVEGVLVGQTRADSALTVKVPSGRVNVAATRYPNEWGGDELSLAPNEVSTRSIVLQDDKEPSEDTDLVIEEAPDDVLPLAGSSLTLRFLDAGTRVPISTIEGIELQDPRDQHMFAEFHESFRVQDGAMVPKDPADLYERIAEYSMYGRPIQITAHAIDTQGRTHDASVVFRAGRSKLSVTLVPPPSNPELAVSGIRVRVSLEGSDVAFGRVADAAGRFEIDSVPDGTLAFDAVTVAAGKYYYARAILVMCGDRSVSVMMQNVADVVKGVPELLADPPGPCPALPRR
jgi:hypothetical protein